MNRILTIIAFAALLMGLSVTASYAGAWGICQPGCDCPLNPSPKPKSYASQQFDNKSMFGLQESHAQAIRVRDRATARQIHHQNDNGPGMTCFDHAMALTSRLGQLFSDDHPTKAIPAASIRVFGDSAYPGYGADQYLIAALNTVVYPTLSKHADDFAPDSLSTELGATSFPLTGGFMSMIMGMINGWLNGITGYIKQIDTYVKNLNKLWGYFQQIVDALNGAIPTAIIAWVPLIMNVWNNIIVPLITTTIGDIMTYLIGPLITNIVNTIMGRLGSLTYFQNPGGAQGGECSRIQNLWGVGGGYPASFQTGIMRALTGTGIQTGNAYFSYTNLVYGAPPGIGADFLDELNLGSPALNKDMLDRAMKDLTGPLSNVATTPIKTWVKPQIFSPGTPTSSIINAM